MTRSLSTLIALATLTLGATAVYAQTTAPAPAPSNCGMETWSTDKMTYVTVPCNSSGTAADQAQAPNGQKAPPCGPETWDTAKMMYVGTPCPGGITYENPSAPPQQ
jgi:hypothetical protein